MNDIIRRAELPVRTSVIRPNTGAMARITVERFLPMMNGRSPERMLAASPPNCIADDSTPWKLAVKPYP